MSWKGFQKAVVRLPQQIATKAGYAEETVDTEFNDLNKSFQAFYSLSKKLYEEARLFKDSLSRMLDYQASYAETLAKVFQPIKSPNSDTPVQLEHSEEKAFETSMKDVREQLKPELDVIERRVVLPTADLMVILDNVRKLITKREHKLVDYDRFREAQRKLAERPDRDYKDERKLGQSEIALDNATREYNNVNNLLKQQIPILLTLKISFIDPCFQTLYFYQLHCHHVLYYSFYNLGSAYFDLSADVKEVFARKYEPCLEAFSQMTTIRRPLRKQPSIGGGSQSGGSPGADSELSDAAADGTSPYDAPPQYSPMGGSEARPSPGAGNPFASSNALNKSQPHTLPRMAPSTSSSMADGGKVSWGPNSPVAGSAASSSAAPGNPFTAAAAVAASKPPIASPNPFAKTASGKPPIASPNPFAKATSPQSATTSSSPGNPWAAQGASFSSVHKATAPQGGFKLPSPATTASNKKYVVALYDFNGEAEGDLSFRRDDKIELLQRTAETNDWWKGRLNGREGMFPGNYVSEL